MMISGRPRGVPTSDVKWVDQEGTREIITWHGQTFLALVVSPRDGVTGSHDHESLLVTVHYHDTNGLDI